MVEPATPGEGRMPSSRACGICVFGGAALDVGAAGLWTNCDRRAGAAVELSCATIFCSGCPSARRYQHLRRKRHSTTGSRLRPKKLGRQNNRLRKRYRPAPRKEVVTPHRHYSPAKATPSRFSLTPFLTQ